MPSGNVPAQRLGVSNNTLWGSAMQAVKLDSPFIAKEIATDKQLPGRASR